MSSQQFAISTPGHEEQVFLLTVFPVACHSTPRLGCCFESVSGSCPHPSSSSLLPPNVSLLSRECVPTLQGVCPPHARVSLFPLWLLFLHRQGGMWLVQRDPMATALQRTWLGAFLEAPARGTARISLLLQSWAMAHHPLLRAHSPESLLLLL